MALTVNPTLPVITAQPVGGIAAGVVLQPGTVVNAQVVAAAENLVQIAIAGLTIDVLSEIPLSVGQNLQLSVSEAEGGTIRLAVVGQGAAGAGPAAATADTQNLAPNAQVAALAAPSAVAPASNDPLTPLERIAVSIASESAATEQESLSPLFANLNAVATTTSLPPALQQAVVQVLAQQTSLDPDLTGGDIQNAFQKSGLFLEASLAAGSTPPVGSIPDLKAALIVLRQTLATAVETPENPAVVSPVIPPALAGEAKPTPAVQAPTSPTLAPSQVPETDGHEIILPPQARTTPVDAATAGNANRLVLTEALLSAGPKSVTSGAALNLLQEALQEIPRAAANTATATVTLQDGRNADATVRTNTPSPPFRGSLPSAQPVTAPSIAPNAPFAATARHLLDDTDAALARQTLLQVASLPDRPDATNAHVDPSTPRWNFEIPFATPQGTAMAQFEISRDGGTGNEVDPAKRVWRARFSLDVEPAGPVHALIAYSGERTSVRMWAERPQTAAQLRAGAAELSQALSEAELPVGDIMIREGTPPQVQPAKAGHFLDRAL
jgi:Flagellar hook-length control protein FliK